MSKGMYKQLKLPHNVVDVVNRPYRNVCVTLLQNNVETPESSHAQVGFFARKKEEKEFQRTVYMDFKLSKIIILLDVIKSVYEKNSTNKLLSNFE